MFNLYAYVPMSNPNPIVQEFAKFYKELVSHRLKDIIIKTSSETPQEDSVSVAG